MPCAKRLQDTKIKKNVALHFAEKAYELIDNELILTRLRICHPELEKAKEPVSKSPLYWSKEFTPTDLLEVLTSLAAIKAIRSADGSPSAFTSIIHVFEWALNIRFPNMQNSKHALLNRKIRLTSFIDRMKNALIELSER